MDKSEINLRKKLITANDKEIEKLAKDYCNEHKIIDVDGFEMKLKILKTATDGQLESLAHAYKLPIEIVRDTYAFSLQYPKIEDVIVDEKARAIWTKKYKYHEEVGGVEIIKNDKENVKEDEGKEPLHDSK